jgi:adenylate cyclase
VWPAASIPHEHLAAAYAHMGRIDLANAEVAAIRDYAIPKPGLAIARLWYKPYYKRAEDLNHHLEGLKAAGIPEWPFGFEGRSGDQVTGKTLLEMAVGHTWVGQVPVHVGEYTPFMLQIDQENRIIYKGARTLLSGIVRFEKDQLCVQFEGYMLDLWLCGAIYRLPDTLSLNAENVNYVYVLPEGLRYFAVKQ